MKVRLSAADQFQSQAARLASRLSRGGFDVTVVQSDRDAELRLASAEGQVTLQSGSKSAVIGLPEPRDALVGRDAQARTLADLPKGTRVALAGKVRAEMLGVHRPDLHPVEVEAGLGGRDLLGGGEVDAWITTVGIARAAGLGASIQEIFEPTSWATAAGRGVLLLEAATPQDGLTEAIMELDDAAARAALEAELTTLEVLGVGPGAPVGVMARPHGPLLRLRALVPATAGRRLVRVELSGHLDDPRGVGRRAAQRLVDRGALDLLGAESPA